MGYIDEVLRDRPLMYLPLWEASGSTARDLSGKAHPGTYSLTVGYRGGFGPPGMAALKQTATGMATVADHADFENLTGLTLEIWASFTDTNEQSLIDRDAQGASSTRVFQFRRDAAAGNGLHLITFDSAGSVFGVIGTTAIGADDKVRHLVGTWNGTALRIYINGRFEGIEASGNTSLQSGGTTPIKVGVNNWTNSQPARGVRGHAAVYGKALSLDRITAHYLAGRGENLNRLHNRR